MSVETTKPMSDPIASFYDRWAPSYDEMANATRDLDAVVLRTVGLPVAGAAVIELGAGTGKNSGWLAEHARSVVAIDHSRGMLARARERVRNPNLTFVEHDLRVRPWPVPDASADVVLANLVLEHVQQLRPAYEEAKRVLRPGGRLFLCELHPFRQHLGAQANFRDSATGEVVRIPAFAHDVSEYVNEALAAGFTLERLAEWRDAEDEARAKPPRLFSAMFVK